MIDKFIKILRDEQARLTKDCLAFPRADFSQYQRLCGEYQGLEFALNTLAGLQEENDNG